MRVTTFGMTQTYLTNLQSVMSQYQKDQLQLTTGKSINQPSDNPVGFSSDMLTKSLLNNVSVWQGNAQTALSDMQVTGGALTNLQSVLGNIRTQIVQAANGTNTAEDLNNTASVVKNYIESVQQIANTTNGSTYIFAGNQGTNQPLTADVTTLASPPTTSIWQGDSQPQSTYIGKNVKLQTNVDGTTVFNTAPSGGTSLLTTLYNLYQHLKGANASNLAIVTSNLQTDLSNLDMNISQVSSTQAQLGGRMDRAKSAVSQLSQMTLTLKAQQSQTEDANMAQVTTDLMTQQTLYQAALQSGSKMILPTLASVL